MTTWGWIAVALVAYAFARFERWRKVRRREQWDLRYAYLDSDNIDTFTRETFVDFEEMLFVSVTSDFNYHHTRVHHLRRRDGPAWEIREEHDSRERFRKHLQVMRRAGSARASDEVDRELSDLETWHEVQLPALEQAYQRYLSRYRSPGLFPRSWVRVCVERDFAPGEARPELATRKKRAGPGPWPRVFR